MHDLDLAEAADPTLLISSDMPGMSEIFAQATGDDGPADDQESGVELDEDHFARFEYEVEPKSDSDFDHELCDDDGQPLVDGDNDPFIPWKYGVDYTEGKFSYLTAFTSICLSRSS